MHMRTIQAGDRELRDIAQLVLDSLVKEGVFPIEKAQLEVLDTGAPKRWYVIIRHEESTLRGGKEIPERNNPMAWITYTKDYVEVYLHDTIAKEIRNQVYGTLNL